MSAWRRQAISALPEHRAMIEDANSPTSLMLDLYMEFDDATAAGNLDLVRRILDYAAWCLGDRTGSLPNDSSIAAVHVFYNHLVKNRTYWPSFREWFSPVVFGVLRQYFGHYLSDQEMNELVACYSGGYPKGEYRKNRSPRRIG